jgi:AcrR family transcriptional regulator
MGRFNNREAWIEVGYDLFAHEGKEGIQVERLARMLGLNKSGFYHYFGDLDSYVDELLKLHENNAERYFNEVREARTIDPDYLHILLKYKVPSMFQMRLERLRTSPRFKKVVEQIDQREDEAIRHLWSNYLGTEDNPDLGMRYFVIIRDVFYSRISFQTFTFEHIQSLLLEAREILHGVREGKAENELQSRRTG